MLTEQGIRGPPLNVVVFSSGPDIRQLISDCPSQDLLLQKTNEQKIGRHSDDESAHYISAVHPCTHIQITPRGEKKEGRREGGNPPHPIPCYFAASFLLGSSSTSVVLMAAKQAALRFLFPSLPFLPLDPPFLPSFLPFSTLLLRGAAIY